MTAPPMPPGGERPEDDLRTPDDWSAALSVKIVDPDGWRGPDERPWAEPITRAEFERRAATSTVDDHFGLLPAAPAEPESYSLAEMLATGATYRQLDYWARRGWLTSDNPGSGHARQWTPRDRAVAHLMVRFTETGLRTDVAARAAADAVDLRVSSYSSEWGVTIMWRPMPIDRTPPIDRRSPA